MKQIKFVCNIKDKDLVAKDKALDQKDIELKQEIDTKVDQTWIDQRMKDISAIEIRPKTTRTN